MGYEGDGCTINKEAHSISVAMALAEKVVQHKRSTGCED